MTGIPTEERLEGGTLTTGIVRVGNTVRRPASGDRSFQRRLLAHLHAVGFTAAPRFLGVDDHDRDILEFVEGSAGVEGAHFADEQLKQAAALLRRFHDATAESILAGSAETICHNDWSPANTIFRAGAPVAMIDFDMAAPGSRLWDLAYSAMSWLNLASPQYHSAEQVRRLGMMIEGYGRFTRPALIEQIAARSAAVAAWAQEAGRIVDQDWANKCLAWAAAHAAEPSSSR
jgi:aminoglycoside phosphotransferase (APT) family kinase protein